GRAPPLRRTGRGRTGRPWRRFPVAALPVTLIFEGTLTEPPLGARAAFLSPRRSDLGVSCIPPAGIPGDPAFTGSPTRPTIDLNAMPRVRGGERLPLMDADGEKGTRFPASPGSVPAVPDAP